MEDPKEKNEESAQFSKEQEEISKRVEEEKNNITRDKNNDKFFNSKKEATEQARKDSAAKKVYQESYQGVNYRFDLLNFPEFKVFSQLWETSQGEIVAFEDHWLGHIYKDGSVQGPHLHARKVEKKGDKPSVNERDSFPRCHDHYYYSKNDQTLPLPYLSEKEKEKLLQRLEKEIRDPKYLKKAKEDLERIKNNVVERKSYKKKMDGCDKEEEEEDEEEEEEEEEEEKKKVEEEEEEEEEKKKKEEEEEEKIEEIRKKVKIQDGSVL